MMSDLARKATSEFIGTFTLVFFGAGSAVFGVDVVGGTGVAFAFGLTLLALAYAIGPTSGCHVNPAVTLGVLLRRGISLPEAGAYWAAQILGGVGAGALLKVMVSNFGGVKDQTGALGTNAWGDRVSGGGAFVFEVLGTCLLVLVVILVTGRAAAPGSPGSPSGWSSSSFTWWGSRWTGPRSTRRGRWVRPCSRGVTRWHRSGSLWSRH